MSERHPTQVEHPVVTGPRESHVEDQRPGERRRDRFALGTGLAGAAAGAIVVVVIVWIAGLLSSGSYSAWVYLGAALGGAAAGPVLAPFVTLARDDGSDAAVVDRRSAAGTADAPTEGAEKKDRRRFARRR